MGMGGGVVMGQSEFTFSRREEVNLLCPAPPPPAHKALCTEQARNQQRYEKCVAVPYLTLHEVHLLVDGRLLRVVPVTLS
jgi:hypothetical protein